MGGATALRLLNDGHSVRALVRDAQKTAAWSQKGVEVRQGDFNDATALAAAMQGVDAAFLMLPPFFTPGPDFPAAKAIIASFLDALHHTPPPRLVALSSVGSQQTSGLGMITATHLLEQALADLPFPTAFIRAGSFLENYASGLKAAAGGWFDTFLTPTSRTFPMVATKDIGNEVASLLTTGWTGKKVIELGSPVSPDDLAQAMSEALGQPVKARSIPRDQWTSTLEAQGMPPGFIAPFTEMEDGFNSGWIDFGVPGTEPVAGTVTPARFFTQLPKP